MRGTLISIVVGALAGLLLTVGSNVHASRAAASRAAPANGIVTREESAAERVTRAADPAATTQDEQAPPEK